MLVASISRSSEDIITVDLVFNITMTKNSELVARTEIALAIKWPGRFEIEFAKDPATFPYV